MATLKQKLVVSKIIENHGNVSKSMRQVGYKPNTAKKPQNLTQSKGFKELMEQYLPDEMLLKALSDDIKGKKLNRKAELELGFKVKGRLADPDKLPPNVFVIITDEQQQRIARRLIAGNQPSQE